MTNIWDQSVASHKQRIEDHIIETALELIAEKGMSDVSMSELAKRADVSRQTLYNYFTDIEDVVISWMESEINQDYEKLTEGMSRLEDPIEKLSFYIRRSLRSCAERRRHAGVEAAMGSGAAISQKAWEQVSERFSRTEALLRGILEEGIRSGTFRKDIDIDVQAVLIFHLTGSLHHAVHHDIGEFGSDPDRMSGAILDLIWNGIKA